MLEDWGWNQTWAEKVGKTALPDLSPGRVVMQGRHLYQVVTMAYTGWYRVSGSFISKAEKPADYPAVGDWVLVEDLPSADTGIIQEVLPRAGAFVRKSAGLVTTEQIIAANIDYLFIVFGLDGGRNFGERSIERYVTCSWDSGAQPVLVLNKADLCEDIEDVKMIAEASAPAVPIHATSCTTGTGFDGFAAYMGNGVTIGLTGPSGVGKSSIVNHLLGNNRIDTGEQRESDLRGRHTTARRELVRLPGGALLIDTPGLREVQLWGEESSLQGSFPDIEQYAEECRFRDCHHSGEPGCAVTQALADGAIDQKRFESYLELRRELRYLRKKSDARAKQQERARNKSFSRQVRLYKKARDRERS